MRRAGYATLALIAIFAIAGCGEDNNSNDNNDNTGASPTRTTTPQQSANRTPTATPTPGATPTSVETGTSATTASTGTPSEAPTPNAGPTCEGAALTTTLITRPVSDLDTGFSGIAHDQVSLDDTATTADLNCDLGTQLCQVDGAALVGTNLGGPLPLAAGGVPSCVINTFREAVTGTYNCATGCGETNVKLTSFVFLSQRAEKPCPLCNGDDVPNDGVKNGTCDSDAVASGQPCDANGTSATFGTTSNDCLPKGSSVGELAIDITPLTTGTVTTTASLDCLSPSAPKGTCFCPEQIVPNSCSDLVCGASGICENGPISGRCANQKFRACTPGSGTVDCGDTFPGAGDCEGFLNPCFGTTITRTGQCGTSTGAAAGIFCVPATRAAAINTVAGLPGPGALTQPTQLIRSPR